MQCLLGTPLDVKEFANDIIITGVSLFVHIFDFCNSRSCCCKVAVVVASFTYFRHIK